jgi:3-oxoacyl-[acyl-carrier-protein] synthase-3
MTIDITQTRESSEQGKSSRIGQLLGVQIVGVGGYVPDLVVRNEDLIGLGCDADWILQRSGIRERRHAPPGMATSDMAVEAAKRCLENAGVSPQDVDLVIVGTFTPDLLLPATGCLVQDRLGLCAPAFDLQAACASFMYALITGAQYVASGCSRLALVIGADCNSRVVNPKDVRTYPLFGDGAGAVLLAPGSRQQGLVSFAVGSDGSGYSLLQRKMGGTRMPFNTHPGCDGQHFMHMEGKPVFKWAVRMLQDTVSEILRVSDLALDDIDLAIFHQANMRIIETAAKALGLPHGKVFNNLDRFGNTSSGSIPLALDEACRGGEVSRGDLLLLSGFGAGLTWGTGLFRW